jgi:hypothetical protein
MIRIDQCEIDYYRLAGESLLLGASGVAELPFISQRVGCLAGAPTKYMIPLRMSQAG